MIISILPIVICHCFRSVQAQTKRRTMMNRLSVSHRLGVTRIIRFRRDEDEIMVIVQKRAEIAPTTQYQPHQFSGGERHKQSFV